MNERKTADKEGGRLGTPEDDDPGHEHAALLDYSRALNHRLQARKVTEAERGFLLSGILLALRNSAFRKRLEAHGTAQEVASSLAAAIEAAFEAAKIPASRRAHLSQAFSFIESSPVLTRDRDFILSLIRGVDENIHAFMTAHPGFDAIGQFYVEFLRYANNDKGLGIVLTPDHVAELFTVLAGVDKDSVVFDNCCGTGGLLVAAMKAMLHDAGPDRRLQARIKRRQLLGIEFQPKIHALAVSNMLLHGDGRANVHRGDCFHDAARVLGSTRPTVGVLNPPYKNKAVEEDREELEFALNNLDSLAPGGTCVAIVPITCATTPTGAIADWKRAILEKHTLEAVVSMPTELFHNSKTTVVTCVMVFRAHRPHPPGKLTWFGYWRDDGFVKTKHRGRLDAHGRWAAIRSRWVQSYVHREVVDGASVAREVGPSDEWCAEAYLSTDYDAIDPGVLLDTAQRYLVAQLLGARGGASKDGETNAG